MQSPKPLAILLSVILVLLLTGTVIAQSVVTIKDIKKINLIDYSWGLGASRLTSFEIISENGEWKCYQTLQKYEGIAFKIRKKDSAIIYPLNTEKRLFIKNINDTLISGLLKAIKIKRPVFKAKYIYISNDSILNRINYRALNAMSTMFSAVQRNHFFSVLNNGQLIDKAKFALQNDWWTDDSPYCAIHIINKNNDTLKIETRRQVDYMLPWEINGRASYNIAFNRFFLAAIGDYPYSVKYRMGGAGIYNKLYDYIKRTYTDEIFARDQLEKQSETNLNLLKKYFDIEKVSPHNSDFLIEIYPRQLLKKVAITAVVDIKKTTQLNQLISFSNDTIKAFYNSGNFLSAACKNTKGCVIRLFNSYGSTNKNHWFAHQKDRHHLLDTYDNTKLLEISISIPGKERSDEWLILPDGKLLLYGYYNDNVFGVPPGILRTSGDSVRKDVFILFDRQGKLLYQEGD